MNEALKQLEALADMAVEIGQPMLHAMPEPLQVKVIGAVHELVGTIMDKVEKELADLPAGQQMYAATLASVMLVHGFGSEYVEVSRKHEEGSNAVEALLREITRDAEGGDNNE